MTRKPKRDEHGNRLFRTSETARIIGVHPNTIRRYEEWKLFGPVQRTPKGYRIFTRETLDRLKVIRRCFSFSVVPGGVHAAAVTVLGLAKDGKFTEACTAAAELEALLSKEHESAVHAVHLVRAWLEGRGTGSPVRYYSRKQAACALCVTRESLRTWERNGLIEIPRDPVNGYRVYGPEEMDRLAVIRALRHAGYSQQAILRMFTRLSREGSGADIVGALNTPTEPEDLYCATNFWLATLEDLLVKALRMKNLVSALSEKYGRQQSPDPKDMNPQPSTFTP